MKKLFIVIGFTLISFGCSHDEIDGIREEGLKVEDFSKLGTIHNAFLEHASKNFNPPSNITTKEEGLNYLNELSKTFVETLEVTAAEKQLILKEFEEFKSLYDEENLVNAAFRDLRSSRGSANLENEDEDDLLEYIESLKISGEISESSYNILTDLSHDLKANYLGDMGDEKLRESIEGYINIFDSMGFDEDSEGQLVGSVLAVSIASLDWWEENSNALDGLSSRGSASGSSEAQIAPWLAVDIVGAVVGGAAAAVGQELLTDDVNWEMVAWSAAVGAVASSTGAVGKVAKWLFRLK